MFLWRLVIQNHSKSSITEKRRNEAKYLTWNSIRLKSVKKTSMPNPVKSLGYIKCYSSSSPRPVKSPSFKHIVCNWLKDVALEEEIASRHCSKQSSKSSGHSKKSCRSSGLSSSGSVPVNVSNPTHCCRVRGKCTPEPTLNEMRWDCLVKMYMIKEQENRDLFEKVAFPVKFCLCTLGQHCTSKFLMHCWPR